MMNLLPVVGSPRKGKATDLLVDRVIEGVKSKAPNCNVKKLRWNQGHLHISQIYRHGIIADYIIKARKKVQEEKRAQEKKERLAH